MTLGTGKERVWMPVGYSSAAEAAQAWAGIPKNETVKWRAVFIYEYDVPKDEEIRNVGPRMYVQGKGFDRRWHKVRRPLLVNGKEVVSRDAIRGMKLTDTKAGIVGERTRAPSSDGAGPSGLCRQRVSPAMDEVRAKYRSGGRIRPWKKLKKSDLVSVATQTVCSQEQFAPPDKAAKYAEKCTQTVEEVLDVLQDAGASVKEEYLNNPAEVDRDICHALEDSGIQWAQPPNRPEGAPPTGDPNTEPESPPQPSEVPPIPSVEDLKKRWEELKEKKVRDKYLEAFGQFLANPSGWIASYRQTHLDAIGQASNDADILVSICGSFDTLFRCLEDRSQDGSRPKRDADQGKPDLCAELLIALREPDGQSQRQSEPPSTTTSATAHQTQPSTPDAGKSVAPPADPAVAKAIGSVLGIGATLAAAGLAAFAATPEGAALLASAATTLGLEAGAGLGDAVNAAVIRVAQVLIRQLRLVVQRAIRQLLRLGYRSRTGLRNLISDSIRRHARFEGDTELTSLLRTPGRAT
ncbi:hypothetical protein MAJ_11296, partial [Metarhizium majus ARSEF 297]